MGFRFSLFITFIAILMAPLSYSSAQIGTPSAQHSIQQALQNMPLEKMMEVAQCLENLDQKALKSLEEKAMQVQSKIRNLCKESGETAAKFYAQRNAAMLLNEPVIRKARQCSQTLATKISAGIHLSENDSLCTQFHQ